MRTAVLSSVAASLRSLLTTLSIALLAACGSDSTPAALRLRHAQEIQRQSNVLFDTQIRQYMKGLKWIAGYFPHLIVL